MQVVALTLALLLLQWELAPAALHLRFDGGAELSRGELWELVRAARSRALDLGDEETAELAVRAAIEFGHPEIVATCVWEQAQLLIGDGEFEAARAALVAGLHPYRNVAEWMPPWLELELGSLAHTTDEFPEAFAWIDGAEAAALAKRFDLADDRRAYYRHDVLPCTIYGERGRLYQRLGNLDLAWHWFAEERAAAEGTGDASVRQTAALNHIRYLFAARRFEALLKAIEEGPSFAAREGAQVRSYAAEARVHLAARSGDPGLDDALDDALAALLDRHLAAYRLSPLLRLARLQIERGRLDDVERFLAPARAGLVGLEARSSRRHASYERAFYDAVESALALERGNPTEELLGRLRESHGAFLEVWARAPVRPGGVSFLQYDFLSSSQSTGELIDLILAVEQGGTASAFDALMRAQALGTLARRWELEPIDLRQAQRALLGEDDALLVYLPAPHRSHLFLVEHDSVRHHRLRGRDELQEARDTLSDALLGPPMTEDLALERQVVAGAAIELTRLLLPDEVRAAIEGKTVTVVGADLLGEVPFECLGDPPLGTTHAISYLPSVPVGVELARRAAADPAARSRDLFALAAPTHVRPPPGESWPEPLVLSPARAQELRATGRVELFTANEASATRLHSDGLASSRALLLFTHGIQEHDNERSAALLFADGVFRCSDAERLSSPPLVVLAACDAASGPRRPGDDASGAFAGAFLQAGARTVLISSAALDGPATFELTRQFHARVADGTPPAQALLEARLVLSRNPRWNHPYYHSLLRVVGLGQTAP